MPLVLDRTQCQIFISLLYFIIVTQAMCVCSMCIHLINIVYMIENTQDT